MIRSLYLLVLVCTLLSCSASHHLKRSKHHYIKAIRKGYNPTIDTVFVRDTLFVSQIQHDTTFIDRGDTVFIEKDRLKIKYYRDIVTDSIFIEGICEADTVIKEIPITIQETIYIDRSFFDLIGVDKWWKEILFWLLIMILVGLFVRRLIK